MKYFISYEWRRRENGYWNKMNEIIDVHPIEWLHKVSKEIKGLMPRDQEEYLLINWKLLDNEEAEKFEVGEVGEMLKETP